MLIVEESLPSEGVRVYLRIGRWTQSNHVDLLEVDRQYTDRERKIDDREGGRKEGTFSEQRQRRTLECLQDKLNWLPRCVGDTSGTRERLLSLKNSPDL